MGVSGVASCVTRPRQLAMVLALYSLIGHSQVFCNIHFFTLPEESTYHRYLDHWSLPLASCCKQTRYAEYMYHTRGRPACSQAARHRIVSAFRKSSGSAVFLYFYGQRPECNPQPDRSKVTLHSVSRILRVVRSPRSRQFYVIPVSLLTTPRPCLDAS
jgi:hypothetical protein